jgi:hypothetical protein
MAEVDGNSIGVGPQGFKDSTRGRQRSRSSTPLVACCTQDVNWVWRDGTSEVTEHAEVRVAPEYQENRSGARRLDGCAGTGAGDGKRGRWGHDERGSIEEHAVAYWQQGDGHVGKLPRCGPHEPDRLAASDRVTHSS